MSVPRALPNKGSFVATRFGLGRLVRGVGLGLLGAVAAGGAYLATLQLTGNLHTVVEGEFYRSGQPTSSQIADDATRYSIKTIINLRGDSAGSPWYDAEVAEVRRLHIRHIDFGMSARRELSASEAEQLIALMRSAQKPILIHCKDGADRSGLASALYLAAVKKSDESTAEGQLSIRFGHFSLPFIPEYAMDRSFEALEPVLGFSQSASGLDGRAKASEQVLSHDNSAR